MARWIGFIIAILVGVSLGLGYGWIVSPVHYIDTSPDTLRIDFRTDYVLMVAEAYQNEKDLGLAVRRLALLGNLPPSEMVSQAIQFAQKYGYAEADITQMQSLWNELHALETRLKTAVP
ncbi:MAG: hypothetical protein A2W35_11220 [Chloroflexi bacterium RBG_16_57_11]|nr:MAG: hypothetical protein A2W35_11220 [Chloroflexi bacterium RBG_16_57_11]